MGAIVGRDTDRLDEAGVTRAAVESVAESTVDGVTAPLMFAVVAGPVGAMVYRAINTLDSLFGHQDERYGQFGWAAARIDDVANYVPARCTAPLVCLAALLLRLRPRLAWRTLLRDGRNHTSPNAGLTEAAMAGALGVQLGGVNYYDGQPLEKPTIGEADHALVGAAHPPGQRPDVHHLGPVSHGLPGAAGGNPATLAHLEDRRMSQKPRILIFTGDGKGKTTAALGMAFRASGHGLRTCVIQFIKSDTTVGEMAAAAASATSRFIPRAWASFPRPTSRSSPSIARRRRPACARRPKLLASGRFALVILDEICLAVARGLIDEGQVVELLAAGAAGNVPGAHRPRGHARP